MRLLYRLVTALIPLFLLALFGGCPRGDSGGGTQAGADRGVKTVSVLLFDLSSSVSQFERDQYADHSMRVWNHAAKGAPPEERPWMVIGAVITGKSLAGRQERFRATARDHSFTNFTESQEKWAAAMRKEKKKVEEARQKLKTTTTPDTEIMAALDFADRAFSASPGARHLLYVFSDMQEQSSSLNVGNAAERLTEDRIAGIIAREKTEGLLPDLRGARVVVVGAQSTDSSRYRRIRNFWMSYFKAANAELAAHDYGTTLNLP